MMHRSCHPLILLGVPLLLGPIGCTQEEDPVEASVTDTDTEPTPMSATCSSTLEAVDGGDFVPLCALTEPAQHVVIEGVMTPPTHASAQVVLGTATAPADAQAELSAGEFRLLVYGGATPFPPAQISATAGTSEVTLAENADFVNSSSTLCFDLHPSTVDTPMAMVLWLDGRAGADCLDPSTLTVDNALTVETVAGAQAPDSTLGAWFRQSAGLPSAPIVTLSATPATVPAELPEVF